MTQNNTPIMKTVFLELVQFWSVTAYKHEIIFALIKQEVKKKFLTRPYSSNHKNLTAWLYY